METPANPQKPGLVRSFILTVLASWLGMVALDFLLNAGVFAKLWLQPSSFLLSPEDLFARLPLGYTAFLIDAIAYVWLVRLLRIGGWKQGAVFGLKLGALLNLAAVLGLRSGTTASWELLLVPWLLTGTLLTVVACLLAGLASEIGGKKVLLRAALLLLAAVAIVVLLQSLGLAPARGIT